MANFNLNCDELLSYFKENKSDISNICDLVRHTKGGTRQTASFRVEYSSRERSSHRLIIRIEQSDAKKAPINIETEFMLMQELQSSNIPMPEPHYFEADESIIGNRFFITSHEQGRYFDVFDEDDRRLLHRAWEDPKKRLPKQFVNILCSIHSHSHSDIDTLKSVHPHALINEQISHWNQYYFDYKSMQHPVIGEALRWLEQNKPSIPEATLVHGDYRIGNMLLEGNHISSVIDWELSRISDPMYDLGFTTVRYFAGGSNQAIARPGLASALVDREWLYTKYEEQSNRSVDRGRVRYWRIFVLFLITAENLAQARGIKSTTTPSSRHRKDDALPELISNLSQLIGSEIDDS